MPGSRAVLCLGLSSLGLLTGCQASRLKEFTVTCEPASIRVGESAQCTTRAVDVDGQPIPVRTHTWDSRDETIATVDFDGVARGRSVGTAQVHVISNMDNEETQQADFTLTVTRALETLHEQPIQRDETWREADNPHVVTRPVFVGGQDQPTLTLEAGVVVRFASGAALTVGTGSDSGRLRVNGTASAPVVLTSRAATPQPGDWAGVYLLSPKDSGSRIAHALIEYAGGPLTGEKNPSSSPHAGLLLTGDTSRAQPTPPAVVVDHVEVRKSQEYGLLSLAMAFGPGSAALNLHDNGKEGLMITANEVGTLPADTQLTANALGGVLVMASPISNTQTWPRLAQPYRLTSGRAGLAAQVFVGSPSGAVLTLPEGTELQMPAGAALVVGSGGSGALVARGTEAAPIRFVADAPAPTPGHWSGLHFMEATGSALDHVVVSHAGTKLYSSKGGGVSVYRELGAFLTNSTVSDSSTCGVWTNSLVSTDFTLAAYGNTFVREAGAAQCT